MRTVQSFPGGFALLVLWLCLFSARSVAAATLPGAELTLSRSTAAASCPSEASITAELQRRLAPRKVTRQPLLLRVELDAEGTAFSARIVVGGRRQGERKLTAEGPGCEPLRDALVISLLLLLDDDAESDAPAEAPLAPLRPPPATLWLTAGGAASHGLPRAWSSAWYAELALRLPSWDFGLGGAWAPSRQIEFAPGSITVQTLAGRAHGCYVFTWPNWRLGGCLRGVLALLHGQAQDFSQNESATRPWLLLGAGPELRWAVLPRLSLGLSAQFLASTHAQSFSIRGLPGISYGTDGWVGWLGGDVGVQLW